MLGGEVYVGFAFAQQLHGLVGFVFAKLIDTITLGSTLRAFQSRQSIGNEPCD